MESKAISAIEQLEAIIKAFESYYNTGVERLPERVTERLLKLEQLSFELKGYCKRGICANIIREAVNGMNWKIIVDVHGDTDAEEWALYNTIASLNEIAKSNEPQQTENQDKPISLDEALEFIPSKHKETAKSVFERLLQDGTIKAKGKGFEWLKKPQNGLLWYFAANANVHWELKKSNGNFYWQPFVDLFGVKSARFIEWQNKTQWGTEKKGIRNLPDGFEYIEEIFP